jgi:hypothetical protein
MYCSLDWQPQIMIPDSARRPEVEEKFQTRFGKTSGIIQDTIAATYDIHGHSEQNQERDYIRGGLNSTLASFVRASNKGWKDELRLILDEAIELDRLVTQARARVQWVFPEPGYGIRGLLQFYFYGIGEWGARNPSQVRPEGATGYSASDEKARQGRRSRLQQGVFTIAYGSNLPAIDATDWRS